MDVVSFRVPGCSAAVAAPDYSRVLFAVAIRRASTDDRKWNERPTTEHSPPSFGFQRIKLMSAKNEGATMPELAPQHESIVVGRSSKIHSHFRAI